jgi:putative transposase
MVLYPIPYEKDISERPLQCGVDPFATFPTHPESREKTTRTHSLGNVFDAIFYVLKSGCHWRLLPHDFPPSSTVYYHLKIAP